MKELKLHSAEAATLRKMDDLLVPASAEGYYVTGKPGHILLVVRNQLKRRYRTVVVTWEPAGEYAITIGPGKDYILGPFGLTDPHGGIVAEDEIRVEVRYARNRGLRICAIMPPMDGQTVRTTTPVQWFGLQR